MSVANAEELWAPNIVALALGEPSPEALTDTLLAEIRAHTRADSDRAFVAWSLTLPWTRFCTVVRLAAGEAAADELERIRREEEEP